VINWALGKVQRQPETQPEMDNRPAWQVGEDQRQAFYEALGYTEAEKEPTGPPEVWLMDCLFMLLIERN